MFESTQIFCFLQNFSNSVPNGKSNIRQAALSELVFPKGWLNLMGTISRVYSYIFSQSENFTHIGWAFTLNIFEYG